jgi:hypothetical protein
MVVHSDLWRSFAPSGLCASRFWGWGSVDGYTLATLKRELELPRESFRKDRMRNDGRAPRNR